MKKKKIKNRKWFLAILKGLIKIFKRKPKFVYLDENIKDGTIFLSNHVGTSAPLALECYFKRPFRFWGAHEMNSGLKSLYKYQSEVYYHQKKHWNLKLAKFACLLFAPVTYVFYKGLNLISTYKDSRFKKTLDESVETIKQGQSIVIFPEDSSEGYLDNLKGFFGGFLLLAKKLYKENIDVPICVCYLNKNKNTYIFDKPIMYSSLVNHNLTREQICKMLCDRANDLYKMTLDDKTEENN